MKFGPSCLNARSLVGAAVKIAARQRMEFQDQVNSAELRFCALGQSRDVDVGR